MHFTASASPPFGCTWITPDVFQLVGYPAQRFTSSPRFWVDQIHPEDHPDVMAHTAELLERGQAVFEYRFRTITGEYLRVRDAAAVRYDKAGHPLEVVGTWEPIAEPSGEEKAARVDAVLAASPAVLFSSAPELPDRVRFMTDNVRTILGYTPDDFIQSPGFGVSLVHPDDVGWVLASMKGFLEDPQRSRQSLTYRFRRVDGTYRWMRQDHVLLRQEDGTPSELVGSWSDVSELLRSEQSLAHFFSLSLDLLCIADYAGHFVRVNPTFTELLGWSEKDLLDRPFLDFVHPDDVEATVAAMADLEKGALIEAFENRYRTKDGEYLHFLWKAAPDPEHELIYAAARDITRRKRAEEELRRTQDALESRVEERTNELARANRALASELARRESAESSQRETEASYVRLVEQAPVGILKVGEDGRVLRSNAALTGLLGREPMAPSQGAPGESVRDWFVDPDGWDTLRTRLDQTHSVTSLRFRWRGSGGREILVRIDASKWTNPADGRPRYELFVADVTERDELERRMRQSEKLTALGTFAGGIAHDFNNVLTPIVLNAELLLRSVRSGIDAASVDEVREDLQVIKEAGQKAATLTRQILAFSRPEQTDRQVLDLNNVVAGMSRMLDRILPEDIEMVFEAAAEEIPLEASPAQLEQVLMNLVVNARDAMPSGGQLTVETRVEQVGRRPGFAWAPDFEPGEYGVLVVSDVGIGMDAATRERIFEPFFTTKVAGRGTGLGLATVHGIVRESGGQIHVYSEPGKGTSFRVYFPLTREEGLARTGPASSQPLKPNRELAVLVADDEPPVLAAVAATLRAEGHQALAVRGSDEVLGLLATQQGPIDVVLVDVVLGAESSRQFVDKVRRAHPEARVVMMSGYSRLALVRDGVIDEGVPFLSKPFTPESLLAELAKALG